MAGPAFVPPRWRKPAPLGYAAAIDSVGAVGSCWRVQPDLRHRGQQHRRGLPLAGRGHARLAAAAVALIGAVQCTYNTRQFLRSPSQVRDWWPEMTEDSELEALLRREQEVAFGRWEFWAKWTRTMHGAGILILLAGLALALPPTAGTGGAQGTMRWVAAGVAFAACAAEAAWMISV